MNTSDNRRENLRRLTSENGGPSAVAKRLGYSNGSFLVQMIGPSPMRPVSERTARRVEEAFGLPEGTLDRPVPSGPLQVAPRPAAPAPATLPPAFATGEPIAPAPPTMGARQLMDLVQFVGRICESEGINLSTPKFTDVLRIALADAESHGGEPREDIVKSLVHLAR